MWRRFFAIGARDWVFIQGVSIAARDDVYYSSISTSAFEKQDITYRISILLLDQSVRCSSRHATKLHMCG